MSIMSGTRARPETRTLRTYPLFIRELAILERSERSEHWNRELPKPAKAGSPNSIGPLVALDIGNAQTLTTLTTLSVQAHYPVRQRAEGPVVASHPISNKREIATCS